MKGSTTASAGVWSCIGGGSLTRVGCHPLTGILWLKQQEAKGVISITYSDGTKATILASDVTLL